MAAQAKRTDAPLSTEARNNLKPSAFVFPKERRYPIGDLSHGKNALARSSGKPEEEAVKKAVYAKFPTLKAHSKHDEPVDDCAHCMDDMESGEVMSDEAVSLENSKALAAEHDEKHGRHEGCPFCGARKDGSACALHEDDTLTPDGPHASSAAFGGQKEEMLADPSSPMGQPTPDDETDDAMKEGRSVPQPGGSDPWSPSGKGTPHPMTGKTVRMIEHGGNGGSMGADGGGILRGSLGKVLEVEQDGDTAMVDWADHGKVRLSLSRIEEAKEKPEPERMDSVVRYDRGELEKPEFLENGWVRVDGFIARAGLLEYRTTDGTPWVEYRPPDEAFKADSLDSFSLVPLTNEHPGAGLLDASNTQRYQVGSVDSPRKDGERVRARMLVTDASTVESMRRGRVELSCGYTCDVDNTPGTVNGRRYDAVQRNVRGNHVALVDEGRAGKEVRVRMDGKRALGMVYLTSQAAKSHTERTAVVKIRIDGVDYEVSETGAQAVQKALDAASKEAEKQKARADSAETQIKKLKAELENAPATIRAALEARVTLEQDAKKVLGAEAKFDGLSDLEVRRLAAEKHRGAKLDDRSDAYVEAMFDLAVEHADGPGIMAVQASPQTGDLKPSDGSDEVLKRLEQSMAASAPKRRAAK